MSRKVVQIAANQDGLAEGVVTRTNQQARSLQKKPSQAQLMVSLMKQVLLLSAAFGVAAATAMPATAQRLGQYPWLLPVRGSRPG